MGKGVNVENYPGILSNTGPGIVDLMLRQVSTPLTRVIGYTTD